MSALLSIHLVRGSASFLLRLARGMGGGWGEGGGRVRVQPDKGDEPFPNCMQTTDCVCVCVCVWGR